MRRREFIISVGGAALWPLVASTQQAQMPVVGYLSAASPGAGEPLAAAFRRGPTGSRLCRGSERCDRIPLGGATN
jgi:hypothetical protein